MKKLTETLFVMFMTILACSCGGTKQAGEPFTGKAVGVAVSDSPTGPFTDAIGRRSVCVDKLYYNPDGTMKPVEQSGGGLE